MIEAIPLIIVDKVAETRGVHDRKVETHAVLFNIYT
jgi:hypothetical protein